MSTRSSDSSLIWQCGISDLTLCFANTYRRTGYRGGIRDSRMADRWWGEWIQQNISAAKAKSAKAVEFLKRDLVEFTQVIQHDTATTIAATASVVRERLCIEEPIEGSQKITKALSNFFGAISDAIACKVEELAAPQVKIPKENCPRSSDPYDSSKVRLGNLQDDSTTYCSEPDEHYDSWLSEFSLEDEKYAISDLLVNNESMRHLYTQLVPLEVTHVDFWCRYFYRVYQLQQEEAKRTALKQRAEQTVYAEDLKWEDDEDDWDDPNELICADFKSIDLNVVSEERKSNSSQSRKCKTEDSLGISKPCFSEAFLKTVERDESKHAAQEEKLFHRQFANEGISVREDTPAFEDYPMSVSNFVPSYHDGVLLQSNTSQDGIFELDSNIGQSALYKEKNESSSGFAEDWDEDLALDMTEEEIQMTLSRAEASGELESGEWDDWV
ncbi:BSD domain-containing protein 1 [Callorhinchus milii]|uniref:BSD domain-containing protein 1 n=1 Tax=Callorhinchus milii TaxID=7868 RepID=UPI001C3F8660|nr:BSD domain-containing protein 1 [Callorhinchus milii]